MVEDCPAVSFRFVYLHNKQISKCKAVELGDQLGQWSPYTMSPCYPVTNTNHQTNNRITSLGTMGGRNPTYDELEGLSLVKELFGSIISLEKYNMGIRNVFQANNSLTSLDGLASSWLMRGNLFLQF